jgi:hypothetical protein
MKRRLVQLLLSALVFGTLFECGGPPPGAAANTSPYLTAFHASCQTLPVGFPVNSSPQIPTTRPGSATLGGQMFLPLIISGESTSAFCPAIQQGLAFLTARYNPDLGLLNEAPQVAPHTYWLTNDNALAVYTFAQLGQSEMSTAIQQSIMQYGSDTNGLIEVGWGQAVAFPPHVATQVLVQTVGAENICQELHDRGEIFNDWARYADLGFYGALNNFNQGNLAGALSVYATTLVMYDGTGFQDASFSGVYATYKLALALYAESILQASNPFHEHMLSTLLSMQDDNGGFRTDYNALYVPAGNTETSALALLALVAGGCGVP